MAGGLMLSAIEESFGGSAVLTVSGTNALRIEKRLWFLTTAGGGNAVTMPPARIGSTRTMPGRIAQHWTLIVDTAAAASIALKTASGAALATMAAGEVWEVYLLDDSTADGTWRARRANTTYSEGASKPANRLRFDVDLTQSSDQPFILYDFLRQQRGWDGIDPVIAFLTVKAGMVRGSNSTAYAAIDTGRPGYGAFTNLTPAAWPTGSFLVLIVEPGGYISGRGGNGGRGADRTGFGILAGNGVAGGDALILRMNHVISNYGIIQGGGGGGGGGSATSTTAGGGGGGGGGYDGGLGGQPGLGGSVGAGAGAGANGTTDGGGNAGNNGGGTTFAGTGGAPGTAGSASGGTGGAAGRYALREAAYCSSFNFAVGGTVHEATASF